jgi:hypothetical protein
MVIPGKDKTEASFQEDQSICQQHASTHTGYGDLSQKTSNVAPEAATPPSTTSTDVDDVSFLQCMAARGDIAQLTSMAGYDAGDAYAAYPYPFGYGYPDGYPFAYPYYAGIIEGFYGFGGGGFRHGGPCGSSRWNIRLSRRTCLGRRTWLGRRTRCWWRTWWWWRRRWAQVTMHPSGKANAQVAVQG